MSIVNALRVLDPTSGAARGFSRLLIPGESLSDFNPRFVDAVAGALETGSPSAMLRLPLDDAPRQWTLDGQPYEALPWGDRLRDGSFAAITAPFDEAVADPRVWRRVEDLMAEGRDAGAHQFYQGAFGPLRLMYRAYDPGGPEAGEQAFRRFQRASSGLSAGSPVTEEIKAASWMMRQLESGQPTLGVRMDDGKGLLNHTSRVNLAQKFLDGGEDYVGQPKTARYMMGKMGYAGDARGSYDMPVDRHAARLPVVIKTQISPRYSPIMALSDKPMATLRVTGRNGEVRVLENISPREAVKQGLATPQELLTRPGVFVSEAVPGANVGAPLARRFARSAGRVGLLPYEGQAAAWTAGGRLTGNKSSNLDEVKNFQDVVLDLAQKRAQETGRSVDEVLSDFLQRRGLLSALLALSGVGYGATNLGLYSDDDVSASNLRM